VVSFPLDLQTNILYAFLIILKQIGNLLLDFLGLKKEFASPKCGIKIYQSAWCDIATFFSNTAVRTSDLIKDKSFMLRC
jgi:hypothetical protein